MQRILEEASIEFAESVSACEDKGIRSQVIDELVCASYGMAYAVVLYNNAKDARDKAAALDKALKRAKEAAMLLSACYRRRLITEAFFNRSERTLSSLKYRISKLLKETEEIAGKIPRRLPRSKNIFHSRRLTVRSFLKSDTEPLISLFNDPFYKECSLISFDNEESLYEYLKTEPRFYAVTRKGSGELIGAIGIFNDGHGGKRVRTELGILPEFRICGYFCELVESAAEYSFEKLNADILAVYLPQKRSYLSRSLLRIGFEYDGVLKSYEKDGEDVYVYSLLKGKTKLP